LEKEIVEHITEQQGWHWALTSFVLEAWGATKKEKQI
jgi:hypothetical protein